MSTSPATSRPFKRKRSTIDIDSDFILDRGPPKRAKSENVTVLRRYLIGCAHLLYVKNDPRDRDIDDNLIPPEVERKKAPAPTSDLAQTEMVYLYFGKIDRTVVSQSKSKAHVFAAPDFTLLEPYLFPWIRVNLTNKVLLSRRQIQHVAFRIWEYLANHGRVVVRYDPQDRGDAKNVPLGDVRGWWWETDGDLPRNYHAWFRQYDGNLPDDYRKVLLRAMIKPWPNGVHSEGLLVDANTIAPPVEVEIIETPPQSPITRPTTIQRSVSDFGTSSPRNAVQVSEKDSRPTRAPLQRSHTQVQPRRRRGGLAVDDLLNKFRTQVAPSTATFAPPALPVPTDVGNYFGLPATVPTTVPDWRYSFSEVHNRFDPLSSVESRVPVLWESGEVQTPPAPEDYIASPLDDYTASPLVTPPVVEVVESNYDPSIHIDKFWLESHSQSQYIEEPLIREEVVEHFIGNPHIYAEPAIANTDPLSYVSEHRSAGSPTASQCSSIDPRLLQLDNTRDADTVEESQVRTSPAPQYFPYDEMTLASPPHEFQYDEYYVTDFETDGFQFPSWDGYVEGESTQFFDELLFR